MLGPKDPSGATRINIVSGSTWTGIYGTNGAINVVDQTAASTYKGIYHPCGAFNIYNTTSSSLEGVYHKLLGVWNVSTTSSTNGATYVVIISGSFGSGSHLASLLLEDGVSYILLEDNSSSFLLQ